MKNKIFFGFLSLCIFVSALLCLFLFFLSLKALNNQNPTTLLQQRKPYQFIEINPFDRYHSRSGLANLQRPLSRDEFLSYSNPFSIGNVVLVSQLGNKHFKCTGTCFCDQNDERRSSSSTGTVILSRGLIAIFSAFSVSFASKIAESTFRESCVKTFSDICDESNVVSEVTQCHVSSENFEVDDEEYGRIKIPKRYVWDNEAREREMEEDWEEFRQELEDDYPDLWPEEVEHERDEFVEKWLRDEHTGTADGSKRSVLKDVHFFEFRCTGRCKDARHTHSSSHPDYSKRRSKIMKSLGDQGCGGLGLTDTGIEVADQETHVLFEYEDDNGKIFKQTGIRPSKTPQMTDAKSKFSEEVLEQFCFENSKGKYRARQRTSRSVTIGFCEADRGTVECKETKKKRKGKQKFSISDVKVPEDYLENIDWKVHPSEILKKKD